MVTLTTYKLSRMKYEPKIDDFGGNGLRNVMLSTNQGAALPPLSFPGVSYSGISSAFSLLESHSHKTTNQQLLQITCTWPAFIRTIHTLLKQLNWRANPAQRLSAHTATHEDLSKTPFALHEDVLYQSEVQKLLSEHS